MYVLKMEFNYPSNNSTFYSSANALVDLNNNCYYNNSTNNVYGMNSLEISPGIIPPLDYNYSYIPQQQPHHYKHQAQLAAGVAAIDTNYQYTPRDILYNCQRNRYMPYTRSINTVTTTRYPHALTPYVPPPLPPQSIYQTCPSAWMPSFNSVKSASSVLVQQHQQHSVVQLSNMKSVGSLNSSLIVDNSYLLGTADKHNSMLNGSTISTSLNSLNNKSLNTAAAATTTGEAKITTAATTNTCNNNSNSITNLLVTNDTITLQITNLDYTMDEASLRNYLMNQLKPITPVVSLTFDGNSFAKVTVPDLYFAKKVVSNLHRKKMGHKRILVSYTRDSSLTEFKTLRCQVAGLLKDVPSYTLPMYKFRELFQSRFKTSISVLDLYKMHDICTITVDDNEDKFISLHEELLNTLETSPLVEGLQHSVPYCTVHFKREQHKGWAEQDIEPLPAVFMTIKQIQKIIQPLMKAHIGDIPVATLVHCIAGELNVKITPNENGVNLEHLICCVQGIQIDVNNFGIKILSCIDNNNNTNNNNNGNNFKESNNASNNDPLYQISREIIELVKMSPKATMKFSRFIPAYHNHFGKQCRVADYGYTKLIELFEALSTVVQIMGDGENRQITLTHRTQIRRFTSDLLRVLRANGNRSILLSELPLIFAQTQNRNFDVTDYGVCDITDILDGLANSNIVIITPTHKGKDFLISMPKRKQTAVELEMLSFFAADVVELFSTAPQYTILFQKFGRSYQYHFGVQCRLSDYGFLKLADLIDAIQGVVEMEVTNDEDKKIYLSTQVARRVFAKQCEELICENFGCPMTCVKVSEVLSMHKKKFGYQIQAQTLGAADIEQAVALLPYVELIRKDDELWIICHNQDKKFRKQSYRASKYLLAYEVTRPEQKIAKDMDKTPPVTNFLTLNDFLERFNKQHNANMTEVTVRAMKHAVEIKTEHGCHYVCLSGFIKFLMKIIRLLEEHKSMTLHEIKNALNCTQNKTFEYGFPNILSIITDYTDLFSVNLIKTQERAVVTLNKDTEMRLDYYGHHKPLFGSLKMPCTKQKTSRPNRAPLGEYNVRNGNNMPGPPPLKTRALSNEMNSLTSHNYRHTTNQNVTTKDLVCDTASSRYNNGNAKTVNSNTSVINNSHSSASSTITNLNYPKTKENKENSMNSSFLLNSSFNTSNQSLSSSSSMFGDLNNSVGVNNMDFLLLPPPPPPPPPPPTPTQPPPVPPPTQPPTPSPPVSLNQEQFQQPQPSNITPQPVMSASYAMAKIMPSQYSYSGYPAINVNTTNNTKLWDRRQNLLYHQKQQQQQQQGMFLNRSGTLLLNISNPKSTNSSSSSMRPSTGYNELVYNMHMYPMYEPPKPDTPRSDNMPFWIDPIWTNSNGCSGKNLNNESLNIRLPECRPLNVVPAVMSPYTLSKIENMKHVFNFNSGDKKIA